MSNVTLRFLLDTTSVETPDGAIQGLKDFVVRDFEREKSGCEAMGLPIGLPTGLVLVPSLPLLLLRLLVQLSLDVTDLLDDILPLNFDSSLGDKSIDGNQFSIPLFSAFITFFL